jgi:hypothetical protein
MLKKILGDQGLQVEVTYTESPVAPGQLKHHYMPKIPLVIVPPGFSWSKDKLELPFEVTNPIYWRQPSSAELASRELYQKMREFDEAGYDVIFAERNIFHDAEEWRGIWNRLEKAKSYSV